MKPASGRQTCDYCESNIHHEFQKIVESEDAGITIYRYSPQSQEEAQISNVNEEVFVLRISGKDLKIQEFTESTPGKKTLSCPRCRKMIERAKTLFGNLPPAKIREVTGICNHCYQKKFLYCPCCEKIVTKFLRFNLEEQHKSEKQNTLWATRTCDSFKKSILSGSISPTKQETGPPNIYERPRFNIQSEHIQEQEQDKLAEHVIQRPRFNIQSEHIQEQEQDKPAEHVIQRPLKVISFIDFSEELKLVKRDKSELDEKPMKSVSYHAYSEIYVKPASMTEADIKPKQKVVKYSPSTPITEKDIKSRPQPQTTPLVKKILFEKPIPIVQKDIKPKSIKKELKTKATIEKDISTLVIKEDIKPKSILKGKGKAEKTLEDGVSKDITLKGEKNQLGATRSQHSFETLIKSMSEPNVSVFRYAFPNAKKSKKQIRVSSSELIKNTRDMLDERAESAKRKLEEDEEMRIKQKERKRRIPEEEKRKRFGDTGEGGGGEIDSEEKNEQAEKIIDEGSNKTAREIKDNMDEDNKQQKQNENVAKRQTEKSDKEKTVQETKTGNREGKHRDIKAEAAGKEQVVKETKDKLEEKKLRKHDKYADLGKSNREGKQRDIGAEAAGKEQVVKGTKDKLEEKKLRKHDKDADLGKSNREGKQRDIGAEAAGKEQVVKGTKDKLEEKKLGKHDKDADLGKSNREGKQRDIGAEAAGKEQVVKGTKDKLEEKKLGKHDKDADLGKKKAQEAEKAIKASQRQSSPENIAKRRSLLELQDRDKTGENKNDTSKGENLDKSTEDTAKGENLDKATKEDKGKDGKTDHMTAILRNQYLQQKQQELTNEKIRKQQEKEKELAEKKLKELESMKVACITGLKPPILEIPEGSVDASVTEVILKPDEVTKTIIGQKIFRMKSAKKNDDSKQTQKPKEQTEQLTFKHEPQLYEQFGQSHSPLLHPEQPTAPPAKTEDTKSTKMNVYRMRPAKPQFDWFEHNKDKQAMTYDTGEKFAEFDENGRGRWYYRSGELALDYYDAEETNAGQRFVVYSTGLPDERGRSRPRTLLATFDYSGNGIVFDHKGKIRLKYNQTEGVVLDRSLGPVSHWKWHTLNDPPVLQQVMIDTQMPYKDPTILKMSSTHADDKRPDNEEMLAIEFENFLKEKREKLTQSFKPFQIKMKALKINEYFSLRVLDQASIYLLFRDGTTNIKLNIGMVLDHKEIVDTDTAEICEVSNTLDKLPACTDSIAALQKAVAKAQAQERLRLRHELRLNPPLATASADALRVGCSRPLRAPVVHPSVTSCDKMTPKRFKPSSGCNLYYSTQFF